VCQLAGAGLRVCLTECWPVPAATVAEIYRKPLANRAIFYALKQSCKVKIFVGASANVLKRQIWTALIAMLLVKILHMKSTCGPGKHLELLSTWR
jgi:hypothetical protein